MSEGVPQLPLLREDLNLIEGPHLRDGSPTWTLHDPVRNRYFRIGWLEFELLSRFRLGSAEAILSEMNKLGLVEATETRLVQLVRFLRQNCLVNVTKAAEATGAGNSLLFFKIPLLHPDEWLAQLYTYTRWLFTPLFMGVLVVAGGASLLLLFQQWEGFWATFTAFQNIQGVFAFAVAIIFSKWVHELGHGLMAKHFGLRVPTFGVAFMFFWPVLYTDTSDAWRLRSRRARLLIGGAGVLAETLLAIIASLCWLWLPEGLPKAVAFTIAVTTWSITFMVNLNPFMRFDGYFLLSDLWELPNLHSRSFALGRAYLQALLMGVEKPASLTGEQRTQNLLLISYAYLVWIYRLSLYIALSIVAYNLLFKLFGIILFIVEMSVLVIKPLLLELRHYWSVREQFRWVSSNRTLLLLMLTLTVLLMVPWRGEIIAPAVWKQGVQQGVYSAESGRIVRMVVAQGEAVEQGQLLIEIDMPELHYSKRVLDMQISAQQALLQSAEMVKKGRNSIRVEQQNLESLQAQQRRIEQQLAQQQIFAPISGEVIEVNPHIVEGGWIKQGEQLLLIAEQGEGRVVSYIHEQDLYRLREGGSATFMPGYTEGKGISLKLEQIAPTHTRTLDEPLLASIYQGELPVRQSRDDLLLLQESYYRATFRSLEKESFPVGVLRGVAQIEAEPITFWKRGRDLLEAALIQESGF